MHAGAGYRVLKSSQTEPASYDELGPNDPWVCPGPASYPPATSPGTPLSFDAGNNLILSWRAPSPNPANTIFGYKVGG
jgi:hypothetical protein